MIRIVLFDVDGVLANGEPFSKRLARDYEITLDMTAPFFQGPFTACLTGNADLKQELASYLHQWGWPHSVDAFADYWFSSEHAIDEPLVNLVQRLRQQGTRCYLATNQERYRTEYILTHMGFAAKFDGMFSSAHVGHTKHTTAFFEHVLRELGDVQPQEVLFWDDTPAIVATARQAGLHAEVYHNFADFEEKMLLWFHRTDPGDALT
ncbi:MAG: HAD-IA family hydrolase [Ktedonobacteraceae bacterium]|nr:HAD-IA family hydrolase [Chloroflexota bacterium]